MKKKQGHSRKLVLSRETLRILERGPLRGIAGGATLGVCGTEMTRRGGDCTDDGIGTDGSICNTCGACNGCETGCS